MRAVALGRIERKIPRLRKIVRPRKRLDNQPLAENFLGNSPRAVGDAGVDEEKLIYVINDTLEGGAYGLLAVS
jgi:hypothetical protein